MTTYRLQLHQGFTLADARDVAPYLAALGVTHCYLSPVFTARPGSTHGYDVCRHTEIGAELGGEPAFEALVAELARLGMGVILDFVPNHMSNDPHTNPWWRDVLENGPSSPFARFFDIDWDPTKPELKDRLLLPILGEQYGEALERGALSLRFEQGSLLLVYNELAIPINPRRSPLVLENDIAGLELELGAGSADLREYLSVLTALRNLPPYIERDAQKIAERQREKDVARDRLARLADASSPIRRHIDRALVVFNGVPGDPRSFDRLHQLLELQAYRLASWRTAADEINYRRFFDINELAGLRVEEPRVFDEIHSLLLKLIASRQATGIRLDHIDGLFDPGAYLAQLAAATRRALDVGAGPASSSDAPDGLRADDFAGGPYIVVEKILSAGETLREEWPVAGTTGYTFLNEVNGVLVDGRRAKKMQRIYARVTGRQEPFADVAYESKRLIVSTALSSEFHVLAQAVNRLSEGDRRFRDFTLTSIRRALREMVACFPVYRTYVGRGGATAADVAGVDAAIAAARSRNPAMESSIFDFLRLVLLPLEAADRLPSPPDPVRRSRFDVAMRFQQYTAPVQAKGVEDTAFYRYHALASLNEVGGDPGRFGRTVVEFHEANGERRRRWPGEMLATTTHDTKRSEDARARITVLSEVPEAWQGAVSRWRRLNAANRTRVAGSQVPDANDEYLFYQALVGAWPPEGLDQPPAQAPPDLVARMRAFMHKAIKEAKLHTSWITPNVEYETGVARFVERTLSGRTAPAFLAAFVPFVQRIAAAGMINSLAQLTLKIASPGVPDFYQGTELWDHSLVDPDNRRPVDWVTRRRVLLSLEPWLARAAVDAVAPDADPELAAEVGRMLETWSDGRVKTLVTACGMRLRRDRPTIFAEGTYQPLVAEGARADHLVAFARQAGTDLLVVIVPRLTTYLSPGGTGLPLGHEAWGNTSVRLPSSYGHRSFRNLLTGARVASTVPPMSDSTRLDVWQVLHVCPVALLWAEAP